MKKMLLLLVPVFMLIGCGANPVGIVKNGTLKMDPSVTVGDALNGYKYFGETSWKTFEDQQNRTIVEFNGVLDFDKFVGSNLDEYGIAITADSVKKTREKMGDIKLTYIAQFTISKSNDSFNVRASAINMSGTHQETGKPVSKNIPDSDFSTLLMIYSNKPELSTMGLLGQS